MRAILLIITVVFLATGTEAIEEQLSGEVPAMAAISEKLGTIPAIDTEFVDALGNPVTISQLTSGDIPTIITPVYYSCPRLCGLVLEGLVSALKKIDQVAGKDFNIITVSFDHSEGPEIAREKQKKYLKELNIDTSSWRFLTGSKENIKTLMDSLGFAYTEDNGEFIHTGAFMITNARRELVSYFYGISPRPRDLTLSLTDAGGGTFLDQAVLYCFRFDVTAGKYTLSVLQLAKVFSILVLCGLITFLWKTRHFQKKTG